MSPSARVQVQEAATDIPVPNDDAEIDWNRTVETQGSPFRPPTVAAASTQGAETSQRQPDPRYMAPELVPPQTQNQAQSIPEIDPRPRHYCRDPYVAPQAHGGLPTGYPTHLPGPTYHGTATVPQQIPTSWGASAAAPGPAPAANTSPFLNS